MGLVEAVYLVEEQDGADVSLAEPVGSPGHQFADILDGGRHGRHLSEVLGCDPGDHPGQGGLAGTRRTPQDHRGEPVAFDEGPHRSARAKQVVLADDVVKSGGSQAVGQRGPSSQAVHSSRGKQVGGHPTEPSGLRAGRGLTLTRGEGGPPDPVRRGAGRRSGWARRSAGRRPIGSSGKRSLHGCSPPQLERL